MMKPRTQAARRQAEAEPSKAADPVAVATQVVGSGEPSSMPSGGFRITRTHGFRDEFGDAWFWHAGALVRNPYVMRLVVDHVVPHEAIEQEDP